ncbi:MAG: hypothetical protein ACTHZ7_15885, partial [Sphingobacterium sp.]
IKNNKLFIILDTVYFTVSKRQIVYLDYHFIMIALLARSATALEHLHPSDSIGLVSKQSLRNISLS